MKSDSPDSPDSLLRTIIVALFFSASVALALPVAGVVAPAFAAAPAGLPDFTDLVDRAGPAVVNIRTSERAKIGANGNGAGAGPEDEEMQEFFRRFFGIPIPPRQQQPAPNQRRKAPQSEELVPRGVGSGFIVSADGFVLTNAHVVDGADEVYVTLTDKREFKARIVGIDKRSDVGVVKIEGSNLPRLAVGDSSKVRVGEWVLAIGSPFGLDNTVTAGIVSAKARDTGDYLPLIQTDVAVNPGNSGGPLLNMRGEVIGINSQIYSRSGGYMGISFAIPIDEAIRVADQLRTSGKVTRGRIGVAIGEVTKDVAESLGLQRAQGALVQRVEPASPAEKAGIEAGDIILRYSGTPIEKASDLPRLVGNTKPGTRVTLAVWRKGAARDISVTIAEMEAEKTAKKEAAKPKVAPASNMLGLAVTDLTDAQKKELRLDGGVLVEASDGSSARAGLRPGDVILRINNTDIKDAKQFSAAVAKLEPKRAALLLVRRGEATQFVPVKP
ncbi:DegQ family serine endoprotease [Lacisediminimonas sp.]|uniref:DegQ family serine endoprotease n=1 Tax=Lacisediminimonas sp. TaxID=3060582 RepID=UPI002727A1B5|nr:DegQ family serine endoprotease [Lacisediminimonas sp.]MDO8301373.1 DegQ family serine endoprotease [Lacisediminimonas sp.]